MDLFHFKEKILEILNKKSHCKTGNEFETSGDVSVQTKKIMDSEVEKSNTKPEEKIKEPLRETWSRKIDFLLACIGFSVGLGNVWRFPYLCYNNGGGAFLIPYFISVVLGGIPIFFLEVCIGQFMSKGGIEAWNICPLFKGIGCASMVVLVCLNTYYNVILAWTLYYLFSSLAAIGQVLPWASCDHDYNTESCSTFTNETYSITNITTGDAVLGVDSVVEFWENKVLAISNGIEEVGTVKWDLALCLLLAWIIIYFCIWKGIKTSGKVMYFTATSPYLFMLILLIRAATLKGAANGIRVYLVPKWEKLRDFKVWVDAGTQIFFSYSLSLGTLTALGSYNKFNHNSFKDCVIFSIVNSGTSFFAGFVIFMTLGYMAHVSGVDVEKVAASGPGLAFIAYPKALAEMPLSWLWSILFFIMILLLGLDSQFVGVEGFVTAFYDLFPFWMSRGKNRQIFLLLVCLFSFFIGLTMVTNGGMYVFQLFDYYTGSRIILLIACCECLVICYVYGIHRFADNLKQMFGFSLGYVPYGLWGFVSPIFTLVIFILSAIEYSNLSYERPSTKTTYLFPSWAIGLGWSMAALALLMIPLMILISILIENGTLKERIVKLIRPRLKMHQWREGIDDPREIIDDLATSSGENFRQFQTDISGLTIETEPANKNI